MLSLSAVLLAVTACGPAPYSSPGEGTTASTGAEDAVGGDATIELQSMLDALIPGDTLTLDRRTYRHSGVIAITVPGIEINGNGATLESTNDATSAVQINADRVRIHDLTLTAPTDGNRWTGIDQHKLVLSGNGDEIRRVQITGSAGAGVFVYGARDFTIADVQVSNTRADGIHITNGSRRGEVRSVITGGTGDDGVAVVSYASDPHVSEDISISDVTVEGTRWGRGIAVVGGREVSISDFTVEQTAAAGIYVATEGHPYFTDSVERVTVSKGTVKTANVNTDVVHGAVVISANATREKVDSVYMSDIEIIGTAKPAQRDVAVLVADGGTVSGLSMNHFQISDGSDTTLVSQASSSDLSITGWLLDGRRIQPPES